MDAISRALADLSTRDFLPKWIGLDSIDWETLRKTPGRYVFPDLQIPQGLTNLRGNPLDAQTEWTFQSLLKPFHFNLDEQLEECLDCGATIPALDLYCHECRDNVLCSECGSFFSTCHTCDDDLVCECNPCTCHGGPREDGEANAT